MRGAISRGWACAAIAIIAVCSILGCDSASFVPPPPEELRDALATAPVSVTDTSRPKSAAETGPVAAKSIDVVLAPHDDANEVDLLKTATRLQAGLEKMKFRTFGPPSANSTQADLVREAIKHQPRVLLIESGVQVDGPLSRAIQERRSQGISVVVAGRMPAVDKSEPTPSDGAKLKSTSASDSQTPIVEVSPQPFEASAKQLVAAALRRCHDAELEPGKAAILVVDKRADPFVSDRLDAIKNALKTAGISTVDETLLSSGDKQPEKTIQAALEANPKTILVFATDGRVRRPSRLW